MKGQKDYSMCVPSSSEAEQKGPRKLALLNEPDVWPSLLLQTDPLHHRPLSYTCRFGENKYITRG